MQSQLFNVTAVRTGSKPDACRRETPKSYRGCLVEVPEVGKPIVMVRPGGEQVITTVVVRMLMSSDRWTLFVQTQNSVYRLRIRQEAEDLTEHSDD
jgi:hypothetical protein